MSSLATINDRVCFGTDIPAEVNALLQEAVTQADNVQRTKELLYEAMRIAPNQSEVYTALYKFCFYKGFIEEAEQVASNALEVAAECGGFPADWQKLRASSANWEQHNGPERSYLYSLKALSFIRLRQGENETANQILEKLKELDPLDNTGASVIQSLAEGL